MISREMMMLVGLALAGWGHVLTHELLGADALWVRLDSLFPAAWRTEPAMAGRALLLVGALLVLAPALG